MRHVNHVRHIDEDAETTTEFFEVTEQTAFGWKQVAAFENREDAEAFASRPARPIIDDETLFGVRS